MKKDEQVITLRINRELVDKLDYIAGYNDRSRNSEINQAVKKYIADFETKYGAIAKSEDEK